MFRNVPRRGRWAALIGVFSAGILTAAGVSAGAAAAQPQARVPWARVGPGWELVQYTNATPAKHAATTLYLIGPDGARYPLYTWRASASLPPVLAAWSGDKTRALLYEAADGQVTQLNLLTGKLSRFRLAGQAQPAGYTRPRGLNILGTRAGGSGREAELARYSLAGTLVKVLAENDGPSITGVYSADGATLAVSDARGLLLAGNAGGVIRRLPVPGTDQNMGCVPVRWWNAGTILAQCFARPYDIARLWLVPASGARPAALTPQRTPSGRDLGDIDAWRLPSGLYLQSLGACGTLEFNRQAANGSVTPVSVPGTLNTDNQVLTALGPRLLIDARTSCEGSDSLLWFNPGTRAEQWLLRAPAGAFGVLAAVPYYSGENAPAL
ncbi:MAG TPA: hypothetical protein VKV38_13045 [Trebonia sp.]|nr:hypothetical protein [Trebonia sp.]